MLETTPELAPTPLFDKFPLAQDREEPRFAAGQSVVIADGILQGVTASVIRKTDCGVYLVSLEDQICARLPEHLLRSR